MEGSTGTSASPVARATFDEVFASSRTQVIRTAFLIVGSRPVAEEISQEAFVRLFQHFDDVQNPEGFLRTAVVRLCLSWVDRARTERSRLAMVGEPGETGEPEIDSMWEAIARLRKDRRAAIVLRYYDDLTHEEIGKAMGCRTATARTRVHRGLADLRKELRP